MRKFFSLFVALTLLVSGPIYSQPAIPWESRPFVAATNPSSPSPPTREEMERLLKGRPGSVEWKENQKPNGVIEYSLQVNDCSGGQCRVVANRTWRQSKAWVEVDGHYYLAETIDALSSSGYPIHPTRPTKPVPANQTPTRLKYSAAIASPSVSRPGFEADTIQALQLHADTSRYPLVKEVLPALALGLKEGIDDLQQSLLTSRRLHEAHLEGLNQAVRMVDLNQQRREATKENASINASMSATFMGQLQSALVNESAGLAALERAREISEFQRSQKAFNVYKQYELTEGARQDLQEAFAVATKGEEWRKAQNLAEMLVHQKDENHAKQAAAQLSLAMPNGIWNMEAIHPQHRAAPLDHFAPRTMLGTPSGQVVRRVANKAQTYWVESDALKAATDEGRARYLAALVLVMEGDRAFDQENSKVGYSLLDAADALLDGSRGFVRGLAEGSWETIKSIPHLAQSVAQLVGQAAADPAGAIHAAADLVVRTPEIAESLLIYGLGVAKDFVQATPEKKGEMLGRLSSDVVLGMLSGGAGSIALKASQGLKLVETISQGAKGLRFFLKESGMAEALRASAEGLMGSAARLSSPRLSGLKTVLHSDPQGARLALKTLRAFDAGAATDTYRLPDFMGKLLASQSESLSKPGMIAKTIQNYQKLESALEKMPKAAIDEEVWRAINKNAMIDGKKVSLNKGDVFRLPPENRLRDHRFSIGGPEGDAALYTTRGSFKEAFRVISDEVKVNDPRRDLIFGSTRVQSDKVLDLTDMNTLKGLGIEAEINSMVKSPSHLEGQMVGHLARRLGFDTIISPSFYGNGQNVVILK